MNIINYNIVFLTCLFFFKSYLCIAQQPKILWEREIFNRQLITDDSKKYVFLSPLISDIECDSKPEVIIGVWAGKKNVVGKKIVVLGGIDGRLKWEYETNDVIYQSINIIKNQNENQKKIAVGSYDNNLYILDAKTGFLQSKIGYGDKIKRLVTSDINNDGVVDYIIVGDGQTIAGYDGMTEKQIWQLKSEKQNVYGPIAKDVEKEGNVELVFIINDNDVVSINAKSGEKKWLLNLGETKYMGIMSFNNGSLCSPVEININGRSEIVVGTAFGDMFILDSKTGEQIDRKKYAETSISNISVGDITGDGIVDIIFVSIDHRVYAVNGLSLEKLWEYNTEKKIYSSPALADMDNDGGLDVTIVSNDDNVYCIKGKDGALIWKYKLKSNYDAGTALIADLNGNGFVDVVVGGSLNGMLLVLETDAKCKPYEILWAKWGGNNRNTATYGEK